MNLPGGISNVILYDRFGNVVSEEISDKAISGAELMYDYGYNKISPHRVEAVTGVTALLVYITTGVIMFKKIKGAN